MTALPTYHAASMPNIAPDVVTIAIICADDSVAVMSFVTAERDHTGAILRTREATSANIVAEIGALSQTLAPAQLPVKSWHPIAREDVPTDRTYRAAWRHDGTQFSHHLPVVTAIAVQAIRADRAVQLTALDAQWMRATGTGDTEAAAAIEVQRKVLRDRPAAFLAATAHATTVAEIHSARPDLTP